MFLNISNKEFEFGTEISKISVPPRLREKHLTGVEYLDFALGGGLTPSVVHLFTGAPGAGKTTIMLNLADHLQARGNCVVYNTAEESAYQVRMTTERLQLRANFGIGQESDVNNLIDKFDKFSKTTGKGKHPVLIVDSLQTLTNASSGSMRISSKTSVDTLTLLTEYAKREYCNIFVIGQVNKDGKMAGKNALRHIVDAHLELSVDDDEKSEYYNYRKLLMSKNRFGAAGTLSILNIAKQGFTEVARMTQEF